jgi:hypothetical protein
MPERPARTAVELMRTLDEKFIGNSIAFEAMRPSAALIVDGSAMRRPDGSIDRDAFMAVFERAASVMPAMRQRLVMSPLGITAPLWVPAEPLDVGFHVRFRPGIVAPDELGEVLSGRQNGEMRVDRPLWDMLVAELESGDFAVVGRVQHAIGDGFYALRVADALVAPEDAEPVALGTAPRTRAAMLAIVGRRWLAEQGSTGAAWHEYWRKPFVKRLRRWGGRIVRPVRNREIDRKDLRSVYLPKRRSAFRSYPLDTIRARAKALDCSVNDLVVASALVALARHRGEDADVALLVPVSRRVGGSGGAERNNISMVRVAVPASSTIEDATASVRRQVKDAVRGGAGTRGPVLGYSSYLPWRRSVAHFGPAELTGITLWPVVDPKDPAAVFGSSYADRFTLAVTVSEQLDVERVLDDVERCLLADAEVRA